MENEKIYYYYPKQVLESSHIKYRNDGTKKKATDYYYPRLTFCAIIENNVINIGVAVCQPDDRFVKKTGRSIAYEKAINEPTFQAGGDDDEGYLFLSELTPTIKMIIELCDMAHMDIIKNYRRTNKKHIN